MCSGAEIKGRDRHPIYSGMKGNWIGCTLHRNCPLTHDIGWKNEGRETWGRRHKHQLNDLKEMREYWKWKAEALVYMIWRAGCGRGCGSFVRWIDNEWMNELVKEWMTDAKIYGNSTENTVKLLKFRQSAKGSR